MSWSRSSIVFWSLAAVAAPGCTGGADPSGWLFDDLGPVVTVMPAGAAARLAPLEPVLDLVSSTVGGVDFGAVSRIAVDRDGRLFTIDAVRQQIVVISPAGEIITVLGGPGAGSGQLSRAIAAMTIAGRKLLVADAIHARLTSWDVDTFTHEVVPVVAGQGLIADARELHGFDDGTAVLSYWRPDVGGAGRSRIVRLAPDGAIEVEYATIPVARATVQAVGSSMVLPVIRGPGQVAAAPDGTLYVTGGDEYEILSLTPAGETRWVMRGERPREPMPAAEIDRAFGAVEQMLGAMGETGEIDRSTARGIPELLPALESIKVDGRGRLWVFPFVMRALDEGASQTVVPVDVYDSEGNLLYAGSLPARFAVRPGRASAWMTAAGDFVYGVQRNPASGAPSLVRHRIDLPQKP
jgi:hypothetical protein